MDTVTPKVCAHDNWDGERCQACGATTFSTLTPRTPQGRFAKIDTDRNAVIARIRAALKARSGKTWSVTGGRGTTYGWITIDAPPARQTWRHREVPNPANLSQPTYEEYDNVTPNTGHMSPADRADLARLLGFERIMSGGVQIASSHDYYREYVGRAEGRAPSVIGEPYWD